MNELQKALKINALFSSISGIIMILFSNQIAKLFGTDNSSIFWIVGLILIYFTITIWYEISKQRKTAVLWIIIQDFLWAIGSIILILFNPFGITSLGNIIIGIIASIVLLMGVNQIRAFNKKTTADNE
ncbi:hypothetical protein [uncultured Aquimarina sp.]|uniref:hypothetical protein n=1 Tax=uncultured Aquimarina sp. TaxID=575652 RepID=UPI002621CE28|nr:hypothetical protein [uncultured Aquimarina sp.]